MAAAGCALLVALAAVPPSAKAAFPGDNGRLSITWDVECDSEVLNILTLDPYAREFEPTGGNYDVPSAGDSAAWSPDGQRLAYSDQWSGNLLTQNADGSGNQTISNVGYLPAWSPDGQRIAYQNDLLDGDIHVINADGSGDVTVTSSPAADSVAAWSPGGSKIAFASERDGNFEIYTMDPDGANQTRLTTSPGFDYAPNWSPDGSKIAFSGDSQIWVMNANGSGQTVLPSSGGDPAWSPDGSKIAFERASRIYAMNTDGSGLTLIHSGCSDQPDWQPLPVNTPSTYVRPAGATPFRASLVPAFNACSAGNRTHGPPLAFGSCAPPAPSSPNLTVGVGDGSPALSRSIGFVRIAVNPGAPGGADDTDVGIRFSLSNVMKASDLSEYTGELRASAQVRLTDREGALSQTTQEFPLEFDVPCVGTASTTDKSLCELTTTLDTLTPGAAAEGARAVLALDPVKVHDGGPDGDAATTADNALFAVQGVFVP